MKKLFFKLTCTFVLFFCLLYQTFGQLPCNNWLNVNGSALRSGVEIGDLDISGDKLTVEAQVNANYIDPRYYGGDIVSKHQDPFACNYLLRGERAEITTSAGYYATPPVCGLELNKTYHIAMVYDGSYLKYYRNGFLMSQVSCTGNVILNNWQTLIGATAGTESTLFTGFYGYINEVRIWNVARTQNEIKQYMDKSLPNPATQTGLLAYYTFDDLLNKQGNAVWDGALISPATINQANPQCSFVADSCKVVNVSAAFSAPDTVCVDSTLKVTNTSTGATTYNWSFCAPTVNAPVSGMNMGSFGGAINDPVFQDIAKDDNGNFYGLVAQHYPATIVRLNYGNSLLNTPTVENLGNFGGAIPNQTEGIKIIKEGNTWYAFVVGGNNELPNSSPRIVKLDFGNSLANNAVATNWGNISNSLNFPTELFIAKESGNYYGYTLNLADNSLVRINFGNNFSSAPTAINLGNPGNYFDYPTGFDFVNENGNWYCFEINELSENLIRLDFGNSLLNSPSAVNLGNPGNNFIRPRDVAIINTCSGIFGYVVNGHGAPINGSLVQLDFGTDILSTPGAVNLGDPAGFRLPHSFTHFFHIDNDMYTFIQNNDGNSIIRLKFSGCANATPSSSILQNPPPVKYSSPGLYNIILTVDIGLPTETSACKQIEVKDCFNPCTGFTIDAGKDTTICPGTSVQLNATGASAFHWNRSPYLSDTTIANPIASPLVTTNFIVRGSDNLGCNASDTVKVIVRPRPAFTLTNDTTICSGSSAQLNAAGTGISAYSWVPPTGLSSTNISNPVANPKDTTEYFVTVTDGNGCTNTDSVMVNVAPLPTVSTINDTTICPGTSVTLATTGSNSNTYNWTPTGSLNNAGIKNPVASPKSQTKYIVTAATATGCKSKDSVTVSLFPAATITASNDTTICHDTQAQLYASGGTGYAWSPPGSLSNAGIANPVANPDATTNYIVTVTDINTCAYKDTVKVAVIEKAQFSVTPDQSVCPSQSATVSATGGGTYQWEPASAFSNPLLQTQVVTPSVTTVYTVHINANNFCEDTAVKSTTVAIRPNANIGSRKDNDIDCIHTNTYLYAAGASVYEWSPATALDDATKANPLCTATATTTYIVKGTTAEGCVGYDTITVYVTADGGDIFQMPSAFTPNGDGLNDCFGVSKWGDITNLQFEIFNKWGNLVFRTGNPSECWNGSYKGMPQPSGVYVYWVRAASKFCGNIFRKGTIVLIR